MNSHIHKKIKLMKFKLGKLEFSVVFVTDSQTLSFALCPSCHLLVSLDLCSEIRLHLHYTHTRRCHTSVLIFITSNYSIPIKETLKRQNFIWLLLLCGTVHCFYNEVTVIATVSRSLSPSLRTGLKTVVMKTHSSP